MNRQFRKVSVLIAVAVVQVISPVSAQMAQLANPGFEQGELGAVPSGWAVSWQWPDGTPFEPASTDTAFAKLVNQGCHTGARCTLLTSSAKAAKEPAGNLTQTLSAEPFRMRCFRLSGAMRVEGAGTRVQMFLRFERADGSRAFLDNRPVTSASWVAQRIEAPVEPDVARIIFGFVLFGPGTGWVDDTALELVTLDKPDQRPLTDRGVRNLTAFTKLYGYVRFFHPSDQAAAVDWETVAVDGVRNLESATSDEQLVARLVEHFAPIAPTVQVYSTRRTPSPLVLNTGPKIVRWEHYGVGLPTTTSGPPANPYKSTRKTESSAGHEPPAIFEAELAPGIRARVPLALYADSGGTLPLAPVPAATPLCCPTPGSRAVRFAAVIIAWNVFQHFYPYFDVVKTDWSLELPKALRAAATDKGRPEFGKTLRRLVAALKDGHGWADTPGPAWLFPPITMDWVQKEFIVTSVRDGTPEGIARGDRVLAIDGRPIGEAVSEERELTSAATERRMLDKMLYKLSACNAETKRMTVKVERFAQPGTRVVDFACSAKIPTDPEYYPQPRPKTSELGSGIWYVDLRRVEKADWDAALPALEKAKAIVFDMRGYPTFFTGTPLGHLTREPMRFAHSNVPIAVKPDRIDMRFQDKRTDVQTQEPYLAARRIFRTDATAVSWAETVMGMVEHYRLGEIVGEPTAGTNGNANPFTVPGGYFILWTGTQWLKHDGSQHHGVGIHPNVPVSRTRVGVAAGKDEVLERALEMLR